MQREYRPIHRLLLALMALFLLLPSARAQRPNAGPVAKDATIVVAPGVPRLIDVLALASDVDGDVLEMTLVSTSCVGSVLDRNDGTFLYTPPGGGESCTIDYRAFDGTAPANGMVTIVMGTQPPPPMSEPPDGAGRVPGYDPDDAPGRLRRDGEALTLVGYYPGMHTLTDGANVDPANPVDAMYYRTLMANLGGHDVNFLRVFLTWGQAFEDRTWLHPYERAAGGCTTAHAQELGLGGRNCYDLDRFNSAFFAYWDAVIAEAAAHDIIVHVTLLEARHTWGATDWGWDGGYQVPPPDGSGNTYPGGRKYSYYTQPNNANGVDSDNGGANSNSPLGWYTNGGVVEAQRAFVREAVRVLGDHANVIWEVANEPWEGNASALATWIDTMAAEIRTTEADHGHDGHLIIPVDLPEHRHVAGHLLPGHNGSASFVHPDSDFVALHNGLVAALDPTDPDVLVRPQISDNDCCFFAGTPDQRRKKAWTTIVSGGYPSLFEFLADEVEGSFFDSSTQQAVEDVGRVRTLLEAKSVDLLRLDPTAAVLTPVAGGPAWASAEEGVEYLIYFLNPGTVDVAGLDGSFDAEWLDPRGGDPIEVSTTSNRFTTPSTTPGDDWVLHIRDTAAPQQPDQGPYPDPPGVPHAVPGLIEAEHYDVGGEGKAYHDLTPTNVSSTPYRPGEGVDAHTLMSGGNPPPTVVTFIEAGEWVEYTTNVAAGRYEVKFRYASLSSGGNALDGSLRLQIVDAAGNPIELDRPIALPGSSGYTTRTDDVAFDLTGGVKVFRLLFDQPAYHVNWFELVRLDGPTADDETVEAESCLESTLIDTLFLLDGDLPAGEVHIVDWTQGSHGSSVVLDPAGPPLGDPTSRLKFTPSTTFCTQGIETFDYTIARDDDPDVTTTGTVTVIAPVHAEDDWPQATSCSADFTFTVGDLLSNDVPPDLVEVTGIAYAETQHGTLSAAGPLSSDTTALTYEPAGGGVAFCGAGVDSVSYTIARIDDPTRTATGKVHILAPELPDPVAADDTKIAISCTEETSIQVSLMLANDTPRPHIHLLGNTSPQAGLGTLRLVLGEDRFYFDPHDTLFCAAGQETFRYSIALPGVTECNSVPEHCSSATVTIVAPPQPTALNDGPFFTFRDRSVTIEYDDLTDNDDPGTTFGGVAFPPPGVPTAGGGSVVDTGTALVYTPAAVGPNTDSFTYFAKASTGRLSEPATVTITIGGSGPQAIGDSVLASADEAVFISYRTLLKNDGGSGLAVTATGAASHGSLVAGVDGVTYTPSATFAPAGADRFDYTIEDAAHPGFTSTATVLLEPAAACSVLRRDDFESVPWNGRNGIVEDGVSVSVTVAAALEGQFGLEVDIAPGAEHGYVEDLGPTAENDVHLSFLFDPTAVTLSNGHAHLVMTGVETGVGHVIELKLRKVGGIFQLRPLVYDDAGVVEAAPLADLIAGPQRIDLHWWASSGPGADDGGVRLWVDRGAIGGALGLDNDQRVIDTVRLGAVEQLNNPTQGVMAFDDFEACRGPRTRTYLRLDSFEKPGLGDWTAQVGAVAETAAAAQTGTRGLEVTVAGTPPAYVADVYGKPHDHVQMQLRFDPNTIKMTEGTAHLLMQALHGPRVVAELKLRHMPSGYQLRMIGKRDDGSGQGGSPAWIAIADQPQVLAIEWWRADRAGASDGGAVLAVDGQVVQTIGGLDNDELLFGEVRLGAVANINATTTGTYYLDDVRIWRHPAATSFFHTDDFEGTALEGWGATHGSVAISANAALSGAGGLEIVVPEANAWIQDSAPQDATRYHVQFGIDPSELRIPSPNNHVLFQTRGADHQLAFQVLVRAAAGGEYELRLLAFVHGGGGVAISPTAWVPFPLRRQTLTIEWEAGTPNDFDDGGRASLAIDGVVVAERTALDNGGFTVDRAFLGAAMGVDANTAGSLYLDDFLSFE